MHDTDDIASRRRPPGGAGALWDRANPPLLASPRGSPQQDEVVTPLSILIVEDDVMIGPLLAEMLEDLGHLVCGVEVCAADAVAAVARLRPDLLIVDIGLGDASGVAAIKTILRNGYIAHIFITGDLVKGMSLGLGAIGVQKPFRLPQLIAAIARATGPECPPTLRSL